LQQLLLPCILLTFCSPMPSTAMMPSTATMLSEGIPELGHGRTPLHVEQASHIHSCCVTAMQPGEPGCIHHKGFHTLWALRNVGMLWPFQNLVVLYVAQTQKLLSFSFLRWNSGKSLVQGPTCIGVEGEWVPRPSSRLCQMTLLCSS
jgi:hypothetical protein